MTSSAVSGETTDTITEARLQHDLQLLREELSANREALIFQRNDFQHQLDVQSEQIRMMQKTLSALAIKFSLDVHEIII